MALAAGSTAGPDGGDGAVPAITVTVTLSVRPLITVTALAPESATYSRPVFGFSATPSGSEPTLTWLVTVRQLGAAAVCVTSAAEAVVPAVASTPTRP